MMDKENEKLEEIPVYISKILCNKENWQLFLCFTNKEEDEENKEEDKQKDLPKRFKASASGLLLTENSKGILYGTWHQHAQYGLTFKAVCFMPDFPVKAKEMEVYLASKFISGSGPVIAKRIVDRFGDDSFRIIEFEPERLTELPRIGKEKAMRIHRSFVKQKGARSVMVFLLQYNISVNYAIKIFEIYRENSIQVLKSNPYVLCHDIPGFGFAKADSFALKIGFAEDSYERLSNALIYAMKQNSLNGHVYAVKNSLIGGAKNLVYGIPWKTFDEVLNKMIEKGFFKEETLYTDEEVVNAVYLTTMKQKEEEIAEKMIDLLQSDRKFLKLKYDMKKIESYMGFVLDEVQEKAVEMAAKEKVMILTGGPGTGKSTTLKAILAMYRQNNLHIAMAAPTGRAAKRMKEIMKDSTLKITTVHRLLEYQGREFLKNEDSPLQCDVLVIDEFSMVDIHLMAAILDASPRLMRFLIVGDVDQLPSVKEGKVMRDIIESEVLPVTRLTKIYRQSENSKIIRNAHCINSGEYPGLEFYRNSNKCSSDFFYEYQTDAAKTADRIVDLITTIIPRNFHYSPKDIQVLTPMKKSEAGVIELNKRIQARLNPPVSGSDGLKYGEYIFNLNDKVMQIVNREDDGVYNGDIGYITKFDEESKSFTVCFDNDISREYDQENVEELVLAYACTVHKSQGSEYPVVIMPFVESFRIMAERNLLYTAVTRAREMFIFLADPAVVNKAVKTVTSMNRQTYLKERLQLAYEQGKQ